MTEITSDQDIVRKYMCDQAPNIRLVTVRLEQSKEDMLNHQNMPPLVKKLCEELTAAACLLAHMLKFKGNLSTLSTYLTNLRQIGHLTR